MLLLLQHLPSPSGASSNLCLSLCENPDESRETKPRLAEGGAGAGAGAADEPVVEVWMGFKGCLAAALFGEGDQDERISIGTGAAPPAAGACCAGGLLETAAVFAVPEITPPSIACEGVSAVVIPHVDARDDTAEVAAARAMA